MINPIQKSDCCGCYACEQICPQKCIEMRADEEGFKYPLVNTDKCIDCKLCEKVCPMLNASAGDSKALEQYAAQSRRDDIIMSSSSGGVFTELAEYVISKGGVVFGAKFDEEWRVVHSYTEDVGKLGEFRTSKYSQSDIGDSYIKVREFLNEGRSVLFTGTGCQNAALRNFLRKDCENLICIDFICHGVPSPQIWSDYLKEVSGSHPVKFVNFRDKSEGWKRYKLTIETDAEKFSERFIRDDFMQLFLKDLIIRPSCYGCPSKGENCRSDITISDFWGVDKEIALDINKGISAVICNTKKGADLFRSIDARKIPCTYESILRGNPSLRKSVRSPKLRAKFWQTYQNSGFLSVIKFHEKIKKPVLTRLKAGVKRLVKRLFN